MSVLRDKYFLLRKLHQFTGAVPLGMYLTIHLLVNSTALGPHGVENFEAGVHLLESLPALPVWELTLIYLPLVYHAVFGLWVAFIAKNNPLRFPYARNWNFVLQRYTGLFLTVFLVYHAYKMRFSGTPIDENGFQKVADHLANPAMAAAYAVFVLATAFHFANGLWEFCIDWGLTVSARAQKLTALAVPLVTLVFFGLGMMSIAGFRTPREASTPSPAHAQATTVSQSFSVRNGDAVAAR